MYILGDLVNRGPDSAAVLRRMIDYGDAAHCLLGNHDLNLLAIAQGVRKPHRKDTLHTVLEAPDRTAMLGLAAPSTLGHAPHAALKPCTINGACRRIACVDSCKNNSIGQRSGGHAARSGCICFFPNHVLEYTQRME